MEPGDVVTFAHGLDFYSQIHGGYREEDWIWPITSQMMSYAITMWENASREPKLEVLHVNHDLNGGVSSVRLRCAYPKELWDPKTLKLISCQNKKKRVKLAF